MTDLRQMVANYINDRCVITDSPKEIEYLQNVFADFQWWARKNGCYSEVTTIKNFGRALRYLEMARDITLVRGRSGQGRRLVEVYLRLA
jgi:hypothetical protein